MSADAKALVTLEHRSGVALITIDNPPVNALAHPVRKALLAAVEEADADSSVKAIVLHGAGKNFIAGADIREFDKPPVAPVLSDVLLRVEACRKPVIAALHGMALGGGFETALASHYRCAARGSQVGLPEIKLALLPGAGGTQRLPRAIGVKPALDMMISGDPIDLQRAQQLGLIDRTLEGEDIVRGALAYAADLIAQNAQPLRLRDRPIPDLASATPEFFAAYRKALPKPARKLAAAERIIRCVEAAVSQSFDEALALSRRLQEECRSSSDSAAFRHLFFAERGPKLDAAPRPVSKVCVLGAGTMGSGIAISCATGGLDVTLIDTQAKALEAGMARVRSTIEGAVQKGRMTTEAAAKALARVTSSAELEAARDADLVIEAVFESMAVKQEVFGKLDGICRPGAILATNTSTLDIDAIASATRRPADVLGMHFFSPANIMKLVEIVRGKATSQQALATAAAVTKRIGKLGVIVGNCFGFVGNRMLYAYGAQNQLMMLEGATPERIDRALEQWGMAMGPNAVGDLAGLDVGYRIRKERRDAPEDPRYYRVSDMLAEMGRFGQKTGRGFYIYDPATRERSADPEVLELARAEGQRLGVSQREITDQEIVERCIGALVREGEQILAEGIAASAADIDVIWCNGYGFPRTRGGPMFYGRTAARASKES
jgi:3-hydroxyacyl-CoA dehydrogenase